MRDLYNEYRTARLNMRYYERQLSSLRFKNNCLEFVLALSVSSGVAGLWLWGTTFGGYVWKALVTLAAFLAVLKPLLRLSDQVRHKSEVLTSWRLLDSSLQQLIILVRQKRKYDGEMISRFLTLMGTKGSIIEREPLESIDEKLNNKCFEQVNQELPADNFFIPEEESDDNGKRTS